jgi:hypothetical protein
MGYRRSISCACLAGSLLVLCAASPALGAEAAAGDIPRTADGKPDLTGNYNVATLTPLQRPAIYGENRYLTKEEALKIESDAAARGAERSQDSDPNREAPPQGGDGSPGASGNVGGYNTFWIDRGEDANELDGKFLTSIIVDPADGRRPANTEEVLAARSARGRTRRANTGEAWWLELDGPGPYDDMERRPLAERCLLGFSSTAGPPMLPALYNNLKRIVQTPEHVMILVEMVHDARIVRMNSEHPGPEIRKWLGDSIGWWEDDTLVVDTTNFRDETALRASRNLHVVERFSRADDDTLRYEFTVDDPTVWSGPWSGEYAWPEVEDRVFEYACHEGNYSFGNIMRGARLLEAEATAKSSGN